MKIEHIFSMLVQQPPKMLAYKAALNGDKDVLITLEIPSDAITNLNRSNIVNKETAKYRTNKAKVLKIEDKEGNPYETATTAFYEHKDLTYRVGETLTCEDYTMDPEMVCAAGIHFFLTREVAEQYGVEHLENGILRAWHANGQMSCETTYVNGKEDGVCQFWYANGQKRYELPYANGAMEGVRREWYANGQKASEDTYVNGNMHGRCVGWFENGVKQYEAMLQNWLEVGYARFWHKNGQLESETLYSDGVVKMKRKWTEDGVLIGEKVSKEDA